MGVGIPDLIELFLRSNSSIHGFTEKAFVGLRPSFSAQVRFGEPAHPSDFLRVRVS
jgi:hypothetical protein